MPKFQRKTSSLVIVAAAGLMSLLLLNSSPAQQPVKSEKSDKPAMLWSSSTSNYQNEVSRTKVPGGWFVVVTRTLTLRDSKRISLGAFFYPDPEYKWDGTSEPE